MSYSEDLEAIDRYVKSQPLLTHAARELRDEWTTWYDGVESSLWISREDYDHGRNLRNQFTAANAVTPAQQAAAARQVESGMTAEEMAGGTDRRLSGGMYAEPFIPTSTKNWAVFGVAIVGIGYLLIKALEFEPKLLSKFLK